MSLTEIGKKLGLSRHAVRRRISSARKRKQLDPKIVKTLQKNGLTDLAGLHSGWLITKDKKGAGQSLYFYLGPDQERIDFADAVRDVLESIVPASPVKKQPIDASGIGYANWIGLADLHLGSDYGNPALEVTVNAAVDDLVRRMPPAEKAVLIELGDLLDANDHKGVTPASGNYCEVKKDDVLGNTMTALRVIKRAIEQLRMTHKEVEVHLIKGNHDPSAYVGVLLALDAHYNNVDDVRIVVTDDEYRVIEWGMCAAFPHHGDTVKWEALKDIFADQFSDAWARAKAHRLIMTAHFHHDRRKELIGCVAEHFRTLAQPNKWALSRGFISRGSLTAITVHKERGEEYRTVSNVRPIFLGEE